MIASDPIACGEEKGFTPHVIFLKEAVSEAAADALRQLETSDDRILRLRVGREVVWLRRGGLSDSSIQPRELE